jgi:hypothetical protein
MEGKPKAASVADARKPTMSQCHDLYERPPTRAATPAPVIVTQCHDFYPDLEEQAPRGDEQPQAKSAAARQPAYA